MRELRERARVSVFTRNTLLSFLEEAETWAKGQKACFLGFISDDIGITPFYCTAGCDPIIHSSEKFGDMHICGSGSYDFQEFFQDFENISFTDCEKNDPLYTSISHALFLTSSFLQCEITSHERFDYGFLYQFYGGGYELATFINGSIQKIGDILYVFWIAKVENPKNILSKPDKLIKYSYLDEILLIRSVFINEQAIIYEDASYFVSPVDMREDKMHQIITSKEAKELKPNLNSRIICNYIFVEENEQEIGGSIRVDVGFNEDERLISFTAVEDTIHVNIKGELLNQIFDSVENIALKRTRSE